MLKIEFYFPHYAGKSVNAPRRLLDLIRENGGNDLAYKDEESGKLPILRYVAEDTHRHSFLNLMEWLESEGLWYVFCKGDDVLKIYYPGEESPTSLSEIRDLEEKPPCAA